MQMTLKAVALATVVGLTGVSGAAAFEKFEDVVIPTIQQSEPAGLANQFCLDRGFKRQIDFTFLGFKSRHPKAGDDAEYDYVKCSMAVATIFGAGDMQTRGGEPPVISNPGGPGPGTVPGSTRP